MNDEQAALIMRLVRRAKLEGRTPTVQEIAKKVKVRRQSVQEFLGAQDMMTDGQEQRRQMQAAREDRRLGELPFLDVVGVHMQYAIELAVFVSRGVGVQPMCECLKRRDHERPVLTPSVLASDRMRIAEFELAYELAFAKLSSHFASKVDRAKLFAALEGFSVPPVGCESTVLAWVRQPVAPADRKVIAKALASSKSILEVASPLSTWVTTATSHESVARLGPGFFPLLGATAKRLKSKADQPIVSRQFEIVWEHKDLFDTLCVRLRICDALARGGLLYGPPLSKIEAMGSKVAEPLSRRLLRRDAIYAGDGIGHEPEVSTSELGADSARFGEESSRADRPPIGKSFIRLAVPTLLLSRHLFVVDDPIGAVPVIKWEKLLFGEKEVECLTARLPQIRPMLLRALERSTINEQLAGWIATQAKIIGEIPEGQYSPCAEIINPQAMMSLEKSWQEWRRDTVSADHRRADLSAGLLLTIYDADTILAHLISEEDRQACETLNNFWKNEVAKILQQWRPRITGREPRAFRSDEWDTIGRCFTEVALECSESRLLRFFLEQAAVRFSRALVEASKSANALLDATDPLAVLMNAAPGTIDYWPAIALRFDYLFVDVSQRLHRKLRMAFPDSDRRDKNEREAVQAYLDSLSANVAHPDNYKDNYNSPDGS